MISLIITSDAEKALPVRAGFEEKGIAGLPHRWNLRSPKQVLEPIRFYVVFFFALFPVFSLTMNTGQGAIRATRSATLPSMR